MIPVKKNSDKNKTESKLNMQSLSMEFPSFPETYHYSNGDEYTGGSTILRDKLILVMQGRGVYNTSDGETYEGIWENDNLKDDCKITFPDKSIFSGNLNDMMITGPGEYLFKENIQIKGNFVNNNLTGDVFLIDPNQNYWKGKIDENYDFVDFYPYHPFWQSVLNTPSKSYPLFYGEAEGEGLWENNY